VDINRLFQQRNSRILYHLKGLARAIYPKSLLRLDYERLQSQMQVFDEAALMKRLNYYNQITQAFALGQDGACLRDIPLKGSGSMYWFDLMEYARYFPQDARLAYLFYDVTHVPKVPTLVKSRPISTSMQPNAQSVLYKFCKIRNFKFFDDRKPFRSKKNKIIWRGAVYQKHRIEFMERFFGKSPFIDVGQHNKSGDKNPQWQMPFMTIAEQLENKFVFSIEGNDVATNTKWGLSANSVLFMKKPKYETWLMEGLLIPGVHYVQLKDDYSDLEEKVQYYIDHTEEAEEIIFNANAWVEQFKDPKVEDWLSLKILDRYLQLARD